MELNEHHREALITELERALETEASASKILESKTAKEDPISANWFEIKHYLAKQKVQHIKEVLIANEIDY